MKRRKRHEPWVMIQPVPASRMKPDPEREARLWAAYYSREFRALTADLEKEF